MWRFASGSSLGRARPDYSTPCCSIFLADIHQKFGDFENVEITLDDNLLYCPDRRALAGRRQSIDVIEMEPS